MNGQEVMVSISHRQPRCCRKQADVNALIMSVSSYTFPPHQVNSRSPACNILSLLDEMGTPSASMSKWCDSSYIYGYCNSGLLHLLQGLFHAKTWYAEMFCIHVCIQYLCFNVGSFCCKM